MSFGSGCLKIIASRVLNGGVGYRIYTPIFLNSQRGAHGAENSGKIGSKTNLLPKQK